MGVFRKAFRAGTAVTFGVPLAHKRGKKDQIVHNTAAIAEHLAEQNAAPPPPPPPPTRPSTWTPTPAPPPPPGASIVAELERLANLYDSGMLSPAEYETAKQQLLAG